VTDIPPQCEGLTTEGIRCKRKPRKGSRFCSTHDKNFRAKLMKWVGYPLLGISVVALLGLLLNLLQMFGFQLRPTTVVFAPKPEPTPAYLITCDFSVFSGLHRNVGAVYWMRSADENGNLVIFPANVVLALAITNNREKPSLIRSYSVEMKTNRGVFRKLDKLDARSQQFYLGETSTQASRITNTSAFLDEEINTRVLTPHVPVLGWAYFQYPPDDGSNYTQEIRLVIEDYDGTTFTSGSVTIKSSTNLAQSLRWELAQAENLGLGRFEFLTH
jgi:hypothetical protein